MENKLPLIIPCAGLGYRSADRSKPKFLEYADYYFEEIERSGIVSEVILVVNPVTGGRIQDYVDSRIPSSLVVHYAVQKLPLGFGHAVWCAQPLIDCSVFGESSPVLVMACDEPYDVVSSFLGSAHSFSRSCLSLFEYDGDVSDKGVAYLWGERVVRLVEKPKLTGRFDCIAATYYVSDVSHLFRALYHFIHHKIKTGGEYQLTDALQFMIEEDHSFFRMNAVENEDN